MAIFSESRKLHKWNVWHDNRKKCISFTLPCFCWCHATTYEALQAIQNIYFDFIRDLIGIINLFSLRLISNEFMPRHNGLDIKIESPFPRIMMAIIHKSLVILLRSILICNLYHQIGKVLQPVCLQWQSSDHFVFRKNQNQRIIIIMKRIFEFFLTQITTESSNYRKWAQRLRWTLRRPFVWGAYSRVWARLNVHFSQWFEKLKVTFPRLLATSTHITHTHTRSVPFGTPAIIGRHLIIRCIRCIRLETVRAQSSKLHK